MSGPKGGAIVPGITLAIIAARGLIDAIAAANAARQRSIQAAAQQANRKQAESLQRSMDATVIPQSVTKYAPKDAEQLAEQRDKTLDLIATGKRENEKAESLQREAETLRSRAQRQRGSSTLSQVQEALRLEREAADKLQKAAEHSGRAKNAFDSATSIGNRFTQNIGNAQRIAAEREAAAKIAEENQRKASSSNSEIGGLTDTINALNHEKFAPGEFRVLSAEVETFRRAFNSKDFATAAKTGEGLAAWLRTLEQKVSTQQTAFETAQIAAQNSLAAAKEEIAPLDRAELLRWSGEEKLVADAYSQLESAEKMIASEQFAESESAAAASVNTLRRLAKTTEDNKSAAQQRTALADVIMNALYEQGYDAPTYYYTQQKPDGSDVEFSDLTIFAKAPGNRGDMRMNIDLEGKVKLDVEGIMEGEGAVCVKLLQDLQNGVAGEMDFQITDWGHIVKPGDANKEVVVQTQTTTQEQTRERHGG